MQTRGIRQFSAVTRARLVRTRVAFDDPVAVVVTLVWTPTSLLAARLVWTRIELVGDAVEIAVGVSFPLRQRTRLAARRIREKKRSTCARRARRPTDPEASCERDVHLADRNVE